MPSHEKIRRGQAAKGKPATNSRVLARVRCPRCTRENVPVMQNYRLFPHSASDGMDCYGPPPEMVFTAMLREAGLDHRADNMRTEFHEGIDYESDPELNHKQAFRDMELRRIYGEGGRRRADR